MEEKKIKYSVIIPVYNEEKVVVKTILECHKEMMSIGKPYEIIAVNDASTDKTGDIIKHVKKITIINNPYNLGYGASIKKGLRKAKGDWIIITDADGTYPIDHIHNLVKHIGDFDMVVGNRQHNKDHLGRKPAKWILKKMASFLAGRNIPDLNSGLRIFRKDIAMEFYHLFPSGFSLTSTITLACFANDYTVKYIDIPYYKRTGNSSIRPAHFFEFISLILKIFIYFKPIKMLSPLAFSLFFLGGLRFFRDILVTDHIGSLTIILIMFSFFVFFLALITEVLIRKR